MLPREHPVLIVGAGPAGLAAALELARHEIPVTLVERRARLSDHPRATTLSLRSMELVRAWGLEAPVRARGVDVEWRLLDTRTLAEAAAGEALPVGYPSPDQCRVISPTAPACVAQDELEPLLLERLRACAHVRVELGVELIGLVWSPDGARAELRDVRTGERRALEARYVVAADGARSAVRRALGLRLIGREGIFEGWSTLLRAPLWAVVGEHRYVIYSVSEPVGAFVPAGRDDRWLFGARGDLGDEPDPRHVARLIRRGAGVPDLPVRIESSRYFSAGAQLAEQWRCGCVFLAGDAAHRVTPRGGTGLNLALHDGCDLGWRLAWVLRGWAGAALLDGYEAERRPVAAHTAARSADPQGSVRPAERELPVDVGGRISHVWVGERSTLDLLAPGLTLFAAPGGPAWEAAARAAPLPVAVRRLDELAARALGAPAGTALVARSDGLPVALLRAEDELVAALRAAPPGPPVLMAS